jgi:monofunctional biosynthetic peptidoglycan transglycosylase
VSWVGEETANHGGWEKMMIAVGVCDSAGTHEDTRSHPEACSTVPQSVKDRLHREGFVP